MNKFTWLARSKNEVNVKTQIRIGVGLLIHEVRVCNEKGMMLQRAIFFFFLFKANGVFGSFGTGQDCDGPNPCSNWWCPNAALGLKLGPVPRKRSQGKCVLLTRGG